MIKTIIHKICGTISTQGKYEDGVVDYLCKNCDVTFIDNEEQTIIS
jgi:hypothetical protein